MSEILKEGREWIEKKASKIKDQDFNFDENKQKIQEEAEKFFSNMKQTKDDVVKGMGENWEFLKNRGGEFYHGARENWKKMDMKKQFN